VKEQIESFVAHKTLALAGASSRKKGRFGNYAATELRARGYDVRLVHPTAESVDGASCVHSLAELDGVAEGLVVCVPPTRGIELLREAAKLGLRDVWIQQGAESPELLRVADELGLAPIWGKCILMHAPPVRSFHGFHRFLSKLFGGLYATPRRPAHALPPAGPKPAG
jgi:predicted CoA-binding protein